MWDHTQNSSTPLLLLLHPATAKQLHPTTAAAKQPHPTTAAAKQLHGTPQPSQFAKKLTYMISQYIYMHVSILVNS